jgi:hypothetical protein
VRHFAQLTFVCFVLSRNWGRKRLCRGGPDELGGNKSMIRMPYLTYLYIHFRWRSFFSVSVSVSVSVLPCQIINSYLFPVLPTFSFPLYFTSRMLSSLPTSKVHVAIAPRRLRPLNISVVDRSSQKRFQCTPYGRSVAQSIKS